MNLSNRKKMTALALLLFGISGNARTEPLSGATGTASSYADAAHQQEASSVPPQAMIAEKYEYNHSFNVVFGEKVFPGIDTKTLQQLGRTTRNMSTSSTGDKGQYAVVKPASLEIYVDMTRRGANLTAYVRGEGGKRYPCTPLTTTELQTLGLTWDQARVGKISALARRELWERALKAVKSEKFKGIDWH